MFLHPLKHWRFSGQSELAAEQMQLEVEDLQQTIAQQMNAMSMVSRFFQPFLFVKSRFSSPLAVSLRDLHMRCHLALSFAAGRSLC